MPGGAFGYARNVRRRVGGARRGGRRRRTFRAKFMRRSFRRVKAKRFAKAVKRVMFATCEKKYKTLLIPNSPMYHNGGISSFVNEWVLYDENISGIMPLQGSGDGERNGDEIYTIGIRVRIEFQTAWDRRQAQYKLWLTEYNSNQGNPAVKADFFHNVSGNYMLDPVQSDRFKAKLISKGNLCQKGVDYHDNDAARPVAKFLNLWIPFKRKITFQNDGVNKVAKGMKERIVLTGVAYDTFNALQTDQITTMNRMTATLYYKDP